MGGQYDEDPLALFLGLVNGLVASLILWVLLGGAVYAAFHIPVSALVATVQAVALVRR